ncbi:MAG: XRE family transcriptional regulator [Alcaligenaceae bacterium]|nr:MAG: XRE family transcriptional regulator [Alcaligenaceae bacterium]
MQDFEVSIVETRRRLSANVESLRKKQHLSQEALAAQAGVHRTFISHVEQGHRNLTLESLSRIAVALNVEAHELLLPLTT